MRPFTDKTSRYPRSVQAYYELLTYFSGVQTVRNLKLMMLAMSTRYVGVAYGSPHPCSVELRAYRAAPHRTAGNSLQIVWQLAAS